MRAIGKNIVIKTVDEEIKTASGLILSGEDSNQMRYKKAIVAVAGTDVNAIATGDYIYYDKSNSFTMVINDEQYTIINERDVVVVL
jgi:co-chaperonin GroES (HSP10)